MEQIPLENWAQFSTVQDIICEDFDGDGDMDLLIAGNYWDREVETRRSDGSVGLLLLNDGSGNFESVHPSESGFNAWRDARVMAMLRTNSGKALVVANNNGPVQLFSVNNVEQVTGD